MDKEYSLSEVARIVGCHPNTIRKYIKNKLITQPERKVNGYYSLTQKHIHQIRELIRQNGGNKRESDFTRLVAGNTKKQIETINNSLLNITRQLTILPVNISRNLTEKINKSISSIIIKQGGTK